MGTSCNKTSVSKLLPREEQAIDRDGPLHSDRLLVTLHTDMPWLWETTATSLISPRPTVPCNAVWTPGSEPRFTLLRKRRRGPLCQLCRHRVDSHGPPERNQQSRYLCEIKGLGLLVASAPHQGPPTSNGDGG